MLLSQLLTLLNSEDIKGVTRSQKLKDRQSIKKEKGKKKPINDGRKHSTKKTKS